MTERLKHLLLSYSAVVTAVVAFVAPFISQDCKILWYQPVEPEGLDDFAKISD